MLLALSASWAAAKDWRGAGCLAGVASDAAGRHAGLAAATLDAVQCLSPGSPPLSLAQLVDCAGLSDWENTTAALDYVKAKGLEGEADYPAAARPGRCLYDAAKVRARISRVERGAGDAALAAVVGAASPAVAEITVGDAWLAYAGGVLTDCGNSSTRIVSVVGVDATKYVVKEAFGTDWGRGGYAEVARNACGLGKTFAHAAL